MCLLTHLNQSIRHIDLVFSHSFRGVVQAYFCGVDGGFVLGGSSVMQAWNFTKATEAMAYVAPNLGFSALSKVSHRLQDFPMEVPFSK